jgi:hypothetical protein
MKLIECSLPGNVARRALRDGSILLVVFAALAFATALQAAAALPAWLAPITQTAEPFIGVTYYQITQSLNSPTPYVLPREVSLHVVEIDPTAPGISFLGTPGNGDAPNEYTRQTTSSFVNSNSLAVGINGDFYTTNTGATANVNGLGMSNGTIVSAAGNGWHSLITRADNTATIVSNGTVPANAWNAVSGNQRLVTNGVNVTPNDSYTNTLNPHTAVGIGANGNLFFMVVDGRQGNFSKGMYTREMADIFIDFGVRNAINLDGGGSSTLVFADGSGGAARTINSPSDGSTEQSPGGQRSVANHFGVYATPNPAYVRLNAPPRPGTPAADPLITTLTVLDAFDGNEGRFSTAPTFSGSNRGIAAATADYSPAAAQAGVGGERITFTRNAESQGQLRFLSGGGTPANNRVNVGGQLRAMGTTGYVGFFLRTTDPGLQVAVALDDGYSAGTTGMELSTSLNVVADGKWHLYEWNLADASLWNNFSGGNGAIGGPNAFIDSIFLLGNAATANRTFSVDLDTVAFNPTGRLTSLIVPEVFAAADFNRDGAVNGADLGVWREGFGVDARGDADGDGDTDGADYLAWQRAHGAGGSSTAALGVPEPGACCLSVTGAGLLWRRARLAKRHALPPRRTFGRWDCAAWRNQ